MPIKAVIFDIDGTLSEKNSWHFISDALGGSASENIQIYLDHKAGKLTNQQASKLVFGMWTRNADVTREKFQEILEKIPVRSDAKEVVNYLKSKNIRICLITGSNEIYAATVARKIGADDVYANAKLFWDKNILSDFSYDVDQGRVKIEQLGEFCKKYNLSPEECVAVGDSENDRGLFALTKKGIAIRTEYEDKELEKISWKVIDNLSEIKSII